MEKLYGGSNFITLPKKLEIPEINDKRLNFLFSKETALLDYNYLNKFY